MFNVKRNQVFSSNFWSGNRIRVRSVKENIDRPTHSLVEVVNIDDRNRAIKDTARTIFQDSIRRNYAYA